MGFTLLHCYQTVLLYLALAQPSTTPHIPPPSAIQSYNGFFPFLCLSVPSLCVAGRRFAYIRLQWGLIQRQKKVRFFLIILVPWCVTSEY